MGPPPPFPGFFHFVHGFSPRPPFELSPWSCPLFVLMLGCPPRADPCEGAATCYVRLTDPPKHVIARRFPHPGGPTFRGPTGLCPFSAFLLFFFIPNPRPPPPPASSRILLLPRIRPPCPSFVTSPCRPGRSNLPWVPGRPPPPTPLWHVSLHFFFFGWLPPLLEEPHLGKWFPKHSGSSKPPVFIPPLLWGRNLSPFRRQFTSVPGHNSE